jgi:hypothetical protein
VVGQMHLSYPSEIIIIFIVELCRPPYPLDISVRYFIMRDFSQVGNRYAALIGDNSAEPSITRFFGVFFMVFQTSQIWGNLISSLGK